jgi:hypothetical protein
MIVLLVSLILLALVVLVTAWIRSRKRQWQDAMRERMLNDE